jgi:hypothetical protein
MSDQTSGTSGPTPAPDPAGAARPSTPTRTATTPSGPERDWTYQVTDRVESVVGSVRDKTTVPITKIARVVVFGLVAAVVAVIALVLVVVAVVRIIDVYLPFDPYGRRVWVGYAALGAIFLLAGAFCWSKRTKKTQEAT